jgi:hypothetical protein
MKLVDLDTKVTALLYSDEKEETVEVEMTVGEFLDEYTVDGLLETPIVIIPPHGRLIDADALTISTAVPLDGKPYQYVHINNIKAAPTIIPAEEEKENV